MKCRVFKFITNATNDSLHHFVPGEDVLHPDGSGAPQLAPFRRHEGARGAYSEHNKVENSGLLFCPSELYTDYNHVSPCISLIHHGIELLFTISVPSLLVVPHQLGSPSISSLDCTSTSLQFQPCMHQYHPVPEMGVDQAPAWDP